MSLNLKKLWPLTIAIIPSFGHALPVDWHGKLGVEYLMNTSARRVGNTNENAPADASTPANTGSQEVKLGSGNKDTTTFQTYIFSLSPDVIINDAATLKLEATTGYAYGGFLGDSPQVNASSHGGPELFYYNQANGAALNLKKAYIELNADTATYLIGRHTYNWGLGALFNDGSDLWDRHAYSRDGITMSFKFNNFYVAPFWSGTSNSSAGAGTPDVTTVNGLTKATDSKEFGSSFLYDNKEKEIAFGLYYSVKTSNAFNAFYTSSAPPAASSTQVQPLGSNNIKVTDIYFKKIFGKFNMSVEVPLMSGDLGHVYDANSNSSYSAKAILLQSNFQANDSWTLGFDAGDVTGNDGTAAKFGAIYLNPNFQVANILFKYNLSALGDSKQSIFDSYITNTRYFKLRATYNSEKWVFDSAFVMAKAEEVASKGAQAYNHTINKFFAATQNQSNDLGKEIDLNAKYKWNKEISIGTSLGYLITGDYYAYTNTATPNSTKNSFLLQINTAVKF